MATKATTKAKEVETGINPNVEVEVFKFEIGKPTRKQGMSYGDWRKKVAENKNPNVKYVAYQPGYNPTIL